MLLNCAVIARGEVVLIECKLGIKLIELVRQVDPLQFCDSCWSSFCMPRLA
jgi:hypothetical protein